MSRPVWLSRLALPELTPEAFALEAAASTLQNAAEIGAFVLSEREALRSEGLSGMETAARYSDIVDAALRRILSLACQAGGRPASEATATGVAILATGGYGRRELAPFSDIDVSFVPAREDDAAIDALVRTLFQTMMDALVRKAGLRVGYAYRVIEDCGTLELVTQTSLVDGRFVAGDYTLFSDFKEEMRRQIQPARFIFDKAWERTLARATAGGTVYRVEPDLKNGPGGLREIHTATWMAQVRFGVWSPAVWEEVIDRGVVTFRQVERLYEALEFFHTLRNAMHWRAGKQNDLLLMAQQGDLAEGFGFTGDGLTASQELMQAYFRHAEQINSTAQRVISWVLESRLELGSGLVSVGRQMYATSPELFLAQPSHVMQAFLLSQTLRIPFSTELETTIRSAIEGPRALQPDRECGPLLLRILEAPERVWSTLTSMAHMGALGWVMPEFAPLMTLAPRNSAHEFTVGYHSLEVVRRLEEMREGSSESLFQEVFSHLDYPAVLFLAGLLHDSGRSRPGPGHSEQGAAQVPAVGIRMEMPAAQARRVQFLVAHHLLMSEISRFRDLTQEASVRELLSVVNEQELLDELFLLTHADAMSVGRGAWTPVQMRFLEELYDRASSALQQPPSDPGKIDLRRYQGKIARALTAHKLPPETVSQHVERMPASYLLNTAPPIMALHIEMVRKVESLGAPVVEFRDERDGQYSELIICALDDPTPGLLSKVAGCLWSHDVSVHAAQVFTRAGDPRLAIDTISIDFRDRALDPYQKRRLEIDLVEVLTAATDVTQLLASRGKGAELDAPIHEAEVLAHRTEDHLICEVRAGDQRGLLYRLTRAISQLGWDIHSARINSAGGRGRDVFYIGDPACLPPAEAAALLREKLLAAGS